MKKETLLHCIITCLLLFIVNIGSNAANGKAWRAIDFNGTNSYINITYNGSSQYTTDFFTGGFTIDFWAMADYSGFGYFYCFDSGFGYTGLYYDKGRLGISSVKTYPSTEANYYLTDISSYSNKWTHFTLKVASNDYATLYINGVKNKDINNTYIRQIRYIIYQKELNNFRVGRRLNGGYFKGKISGFRFWKRCLTDNEVSYVWDRSFTGQRTFLPNYQYLWSYIRCNMYVYGDNNIVSLGGGSWVWEYNTTLLTNYFHPGRPPMPYVFAKNELCGTTDLSWECSMSSVNHPDMIIETEGEKTNLGYTFNAKAEDYPQQHKPGIPYEYKIYSEWNTGNSVIKQSDPVVLSAVVQEPVDSAVFNVNTVNDNNSLNVNWTWNPSDDSVRKDYLEQFDIYRKIKDSAYTYLGHVPAAQRNFVDSLAESCTYYYYKIQPHNVCTDVPETQGISPESIITRDYSQAFSQNDAYFEASKGYYDKDVRLNWKINPDFKNDIMGYELFRKDAVSGTWALLHTFDNNNYTSYSDADADANNMYTYLIR
ncbi:MAG TPA: LamG-like jellyroll fold domain-containing protein, partial [Bacteroidales bacterium]|nr:LamG-like jellyroll fold domain-containing protein [Bacteroidales bacterium]